jgi:hypothetical protein
MHAVLAIVPVIGANNVYNPWDTFTVTIRIIIYSDSHSALRAISIAVALMASIPATVNNPYAVAIIPMAGITTYLNIFEDIPFGILNTFGNVHV